MSEGLRELVWLFNQLGFMLHDLRMVEIKILRENNLCQQKRI